MAQARVCLTCFANVVVISHSTVKLMAPKTHGSKVIKPDKKEKNNKAAITNTEMEDYAFITDQIGSKVVVSRLMFVLAYLTNPGMLDQAWLGLVIE